MLATSAICLLFLISQVGTQSIEDDGIGDYGNNTLVHPVNLTCPGLWSIFENTNGSSRCHCGSDLNRVVHCNKKTLQVKLLRCFCMTQYSKNPNITVVGACLYRCRRPISLYLPSNTSALLMYMCNDTTAVINGMMLSRNRDGQLCGRCYKGFAPPAYSYDWCCVKCSGNKHSVINSIVKYCVIAFLPLTGFFIILLTLRISATSPSMNAFVLASQVLAAPLQVRILLSTIPIRHFRQLVLYFRVIVSLYGFWNLDFFRTLYPPFCLNPNMSTLQVLALDYIIAAYPLLLILIAYSLVELHAHNCKVVVWLWKPFRRCFIRFQRTYIQTSLVDAFASFLLLSYVKFLSVSFDFLVPVHLYDVHGESMGQYLYFDGTVEYFGKQHLPYAILAITVLIIFNILPLLLLCFYPCRCFQKVLNYYGLRCQALHIFMDAFHSGYKNGTEGTRDCRYFSVAYLLMRIFFFVIAVAAVTSIVMVCFILGVLFTVFAIVITIVKPYKTSSHVVVDVVLNLSVALCYFGAATDLSAQSNYPFLISVNAILMSIAGLGPLLYMTMLILYWVFVKWESLQQWWTFLKLLVFKRWNNSEECATLLHEPVNNSQEE